jgi:hypothetical protein
MSLVLSLTAFIFLVALNFVLLTFPHERMNTSSSLDSSSPDTDTSIVLNECNDFTWCSIPMPNRSYFHFNPPSDSHRWNLAKTIAAHGNMVFLDKIRRHIQHPFDFLDGDITFRSFHRLVDVFIDAKESLHHLNALTRRGYNISASSKSPYLPPIFDFRSSDRSPIVQLGHGVFKKSGGAYFAGNYLGFDGISLDEFLLQWNKIKDDIDTPTIYLCQGNENWGCLSTMFPG